MFKAIIKYFFAWRLALFVIALFAFYLIPAKDCCQPDTFSVGKYLLNVWSNFAGKDFLDLAQYGYGLPLKPSTFIFFPLFPKVISVFNNFTKDYLISGLLISNLTFIFALYFLYRLVLLDFKKNIAKLTIFILMVFPTSFFFGSVYTESFFLLLVILTFYLARKNHFALSCLFAAMATYTRFAGVFLWPALLWEIRKSDKTALPWLVLPPLGLFAYMRFLFQKTGDYFYFLKISPDFGPNLVINKLILLHQVFFRYTKMLIFTKTDTLYFIILLELIVGTSFLVLSIISFKKLRLSYAMYTALSFLIPTFTGTFSGQPRFILTAFPIFILIALWLSKQSLVIKKLFFILNIAIGVIVVSLFTRGYFVG